MGERVGAAAVIHTRRRAGYGQRVAAVRRGLRRSPSRVVGHYSALGTTRYACRVGRSLTVAIVICLGLVTPVAVGPAAGVTGWRIVPSANGQLATELHGVACVTANRCVAVGWETVLPNGDLKAWIEGWDGRRWSAEQAPRPFGSLLAGVTCVATSNCTAVGRYAREVEPYTAVLVEHWNGSVWSIVPAPNVPGSEVNDLNGISCVSPSDCIAVGDTSAVGSRVEATLIERWDGRRWTREADARPPDGVLLSVSCRGTSMCVAVGAANQGALVEQRSARGWKIVSAPPVPGPTSPLLRSVACPTTTRCVAVGENNPSSGGSFPLIEQWNGTVWSVAAPAPAPPGMSEGDLESVSCGSVSSCTAVGAAWNHSSIQPLIEQWDGHAWTAQPAPTPPGYFNSTNGISCLPAGQCDAVGYTQTNNGTFAIVEQRS